MTTFAPLAPFMGQLDALTSIIEEDGKSHARPALKNAGNVTLVLLREVISPASFRNAESEITDIDAGGQRHVRAVANKFKFGERARGLQVLRLFDSGGRSPQNRTAFSTADKPGDRFDMNAYVFGDSAVKGKGGKTNVLPVKATAQYSDAISIAPYGLVTDKTFHNRSAEDGTLFDAAEKRNSNHIFERHFVKPGTLLLQTITFNGRNAPIEALEHLLLCVGLAGAYGGGTSIYGVNVRNHVVGIYGARLERALSSPYVALAALKEKGIDGSDIAKTSDALSSIYTGEFTVSISAQETADAVARLVSGVETESRDLAASYRNSAEKISTYFTQWFEGV